MSDPIVTETTPVETVVENPKKFCFTRKQIIATAVAATTVAASAAVVIYLKAKGTDPKELVDVAVEAVKETVESA